MEQFLTFITKPVSKLIAFVFNVLLSSFLINVLVIQSTDTEGINYKLLLKSNVFRWIIVYLIVLFLYLLYAYTKENKMTIEYVGLCSIRDIQEKVQKEGILIAGEKYNQFAKKCNTPEELEKVLESRGNFESRWKNEE